MALDLENPTLDRPVREPVAFVPGSAAHRSLPPLFSFEDPLEADEDDDVLVVTTRRRIGRIALVATEAASRGVRKGDLGDALEWMMLPSDAFGGAAPIDACADRGECMRAVLMHAIHVEDEARDAFDDLFEVYGGGGATTDPDFVAEVLSDSDIGPDGAEADAVPAAELIAAAAPWSRRARVRAAADGSSTTEAAQPRGSKASARRTGRRQAASA